MRRLLAVSVLAVALTVASAAGAATTTTTTPTAPVFDGKGRIVQTPFAPSPGAAHLSKKRVLAVFEASP